MQRIAIYTRSIDSEFNPYIIDLIKLLKQYDLELLIYKKSLTVLNQFLTPDVNYTVFETSEDLRHKADFLVSIGGDGTLLDSTLLVRDSGIPIVGINTGRLGFLARIALEKLSKELEGLRSGNFEIEERTLLKVKSPGFLFPDDNFALNELTIHKKDTTSMVKIHTYVNNEFLNTYWADGLIISTPTGSTAYSLSGGGPIVYPGSNNFIITPVAPHNLNVRPIVLPDSSSIQLKVEGRSDKFLASLDSRTVPIDNLQEIEVVKNEFPIKLLVLPDSSFLKTIRAKMNWGFDLRN